MFYCKNTRNIILHFLLYCQWKTRDRGEWTNIPILIKEIALPWGQACLNPETGLELRKMYEGGKIVTEQDFKEAMKHVLSSC